MDFNVEDLRRSAESKDRYQSQLSRLRAAGKQSSCIEDAVIAATQNIQRGTKSFVIYGEPQSGKTEMMICLTATLASANEALVTSTINTRV
jgi:DNA replication protein DnaC